MNQSLYPAHIADIQQRWYKAMDSAGIATLVVHSGTPILSFLDDCYYPFRANPHFLAWLPLTHHHDCVLVIRAGNKPLLWYYQAEDYWHMSPASPEAWWADQFDIRVVSDPLAWKAGLDRSDQRICAIGDSVELQDSFASSEINPPHLLMQLHLQRTRKTEYEIECLRVASKRAVSAHLAAESAFKAGKSEFDIHMAFLASARQNDFELPYNSIVALNEHAAVLHYQVRDREAPAESRSFLIDAGATCHAYAADITRTYAAHDGEFADLVAAMDQVEQGLAGMVAAGTSYPALHLHAHLEIAAVLQAAGIINVPAEEAVDSGLSSVFFPHGLGHFIGLQTHDVAGLVDNSGEPVERPEGHPYLRLTRELEPGNVLTIEPGLYFIPALLADWRQNRDATAINWKMVEKLAPYGGIRIEDNVVVTESGNENLTRNAFRAAK